MPSFGKTHYLLGYPNVFTSLLGEAVSRAPKFREMRKDYLAYQTVAKKPQVMLKRICNRSPFQWVEVEDMMEYNGGEYHDDHYQNARRIFPTWVTAR